MFGFFLHPQKFLLNRLYRFYRDDTPQTSECHIIRVFPDMFDGEMTIDDRAHMVGVSAPIKRLSLFLMENVFIKIDLEPWAQKDQVTVGSKVRGYGFAFMDSSIRTVSKDPHGELVVSYGTGTLSLAPLLNEDGYVGIQLIA